MIVRNDDHLRRILAAYAGYYNETRTHLALEKHAPESRSVESVGRIVSVPLIGSLHHRYVRIWFQLGTGVNVAARLEALAEGAGAPVVRRGSVPSAHVSFHELTRAKDDSLGERLDRAVQLQLRVFADFGRELDRNHTLTHATR